MFIYMNMDGLFVAASCIFILLFERRRIREHVNRSIGVCKIIQIIPFMLLRSASESLGITAINIL